MLATGKEKRSIMCETGRARTFRLLTSTRHEHRHHDGQHVVQLAGQLKQNHRRGQRARHTPTARTRVSD